MRITSKGVKSPTATAAGRVLVVGAYLNGKPNYAEVLSAELSAAPGLSVDLCWAAIGGGSRLPEALAAATALHLHQPVPKFQLINRLLRHFKLGDYDALLVIDDDIELPAYFLPQYLALQAKHGFGLAQPARTHDSYIDHYFVAQLMGIEARRTRFVEIGPLFSISRTAFDVLLPFDEEAPMGWGLDFVWPLLLEQAGLSQGIIDATPVRHALRKPVTHYDYDTTNSDMKGYLDSRPHLRADDAFIALETFPGSAEAQPRSSA